MRRVVVRRAAVLGCLASMCGCGPVDGLILPPLVDKPSEELPGKFVWHNLITTEPESARTFYGSLFGWEFDAIGDGAYTEVTYGGRSIGGIVNAATWKNKPRSAVWLSAVSTPDIGGAVATAKAAGARQLVNIMDIFDVGRIAVLTDPEGAVFQVLEAKRGDPPDVPPPVHSWLWHELIAEDTEAAAKFYQAVFGYRIEIHEVDGDATYRVLARDDAPRAGILENPFEDTRSAWIPYIRVEDPAALLPVVTLLGGRVVVAPSPSLRGGTVALILDPSGAPLALQKWSPDEGGAS
ncbi:MAG: VOC family protein [Myxococcota bacterium]